MAAPDPVDRWYPRLGPCGICSVPGVDQRHRAIEAIADAAKAGEAAEDLAFDYDVPVEAVRACVRWVAEHPDGIERGGHA